MRIVFDLAKLGAGFTSPNPLVGAVIVNNGRIVGIGYHKKKGEKHAEVRAIEDAVGHLEGSTLYINLEPCSHHGATPPCVPLVAEVGIKRVVISNLDPNPLVNGRGVEFLRNKGIKVEIGVLEEEGYFLNRVFFHYITTGLPYIIGKLALSLDGFIADKDGASRWISSEESRRFVHQLRGEVDAIMVGEGTVLKDNPELLPRMVYSPKIPARIVVARRPFVDFNFKIFNTGGKIYIITSSESKWSLPEGINSEVSLIQVDEIESGYLNLVEAFQILGKNGVQSILCEGGSILMGELLKQGLLNELLVFYSGLILGDGIKPFGNLEVSIEENLRPFEVVERSSFGSDTLVRFWKNVRKGY